MKHLELYCKIWVVGCSINEMINYNFKMKTDFIDYCWYLRITMCFFEYFLGLQKNQTLILGLLENLY